MHDLDTLRTYEETGERLNVSARTVARLVKNGEIGAVFIGVGRGRPRIPEREIVDYLNRRHKRATPPRPEIDHR
jgi:excisionase family DNA binding protein